MVAKGIQFLVDPNGTKTGVVIDLRRHGKLWEDFYDALIARSRRREPRISWHEVKRRLRKPARKRA